MLTPEEERTRAIKVSQLYAHLPEKPGLMQTDALGAFSWSGIINPTILLALSFIAANTIITVFTNVGYGFKEDVAAAGMLFIVASLGVYYIVYKACRHFFNGLYVITRHYGLMFWASLFFLVPVFFLLRSTIIDPSEHNLVSIMLHLILHGLLFTTVSIGFITLMAYILEKLRKSETTRLKLAILLTSVPYIWGLMFSLIS